MDCGTELRRLGFRAVIIVCRRSSATTSCRSKYSHAGIEKDDSANSLLRVYSQMYLANTEALSEFPMVKLFDLDVYWENG
jgi:hypothetical protein